MHCSASWIVLLSSSIFAACVASPSGAGPKAAAETVADNEWEGTVVPADTAILAVWPESYAGDLLILDLLSHGSLVKQGDVVAHADLRPIDDQIRQAELEARSGVVRQSNAEEKDRIDREAAASALEQARTALDRSRRALEGWEKHELEFAKRIAELEDRHHVAGIEDETDELVQLEKMYKADELVDATEDIVLKRSRRALDLSKVGLTLGREQRQYQVQFDEALQTEAKREAVQVQQGALERLLQSQAVDRRAAEDALGRSKAQLADEQKKLEELRRDRELLTLRAPRSGILMHGSLDDYKPKQTPPRHERGSRLATRTELFTIGDPEKLVVAVDVPESKIEGSKPGSNVEVHPVFDPKLSVAGKLRAEEYPEAKSAASPENSYAAFVDLAHPLAGLRIGMRVKVKPDPNAGTDAAKAASTETSKPSAASAATQVTGT